jgi:hypothetical protein
MSGPETIHLSLRESRMLLERIFQHIGVADCLLHSVKDAALYSAALNITPLGRVFDHLEQVADFAPQRMRLLEGARDGDGDPIDVLDAGGQHAWIAAEPALALLVSAHRQGEKPVVIVRNATAPEEFGVVSGLVEIYDIAADVRPLSDGAIEIRARKPDLGVRKILTRIQHDGLPTTHQVWEKLLELSKKALAPDSVLSRTHNGDIIVRPDGTVIGRRDEEFSEFDPTLLIDKGQELQSGAPVQRISGKH